MESGIKQHVKRKHSLTGSQKVPQDKTLMARLLRSMKLTGGLVLLFLLIPLSSHAQYYDLSVGVERHFTFFKLDPIPETDYVPFGIERVIDEVEIDGQLWAVVEWHHWTYYYDQPQAPILSISKDTLFYRNSGSRLYEYLYGEEQVVFDFHVGQGELLYDSLEPYIMTDYVSLHSNLLRNYGGVVILDTVLSLNNGRLSRVIWGDGFQDGQDISGDLFVNEVLNYLEGLPTPYNMEKSELYYPSIPYFFIEGFGSLFSVYTHRGLQITGYKSADGIEYGTLNTIPTSINRGSEQPVSAKLFQNYPNPFNPTTVINYQLPETGMVRLAVYDILGREVALLVNAHVSAGTHQVNFDGRNLSSGMYLYRLQTGNQVLSGKMMLMK